MKNRYTALTIKMLLQVFAALMLAIIAGICVLYFVVDSGRFADFFLYVCGLLHIEFWTATSWYYKIFSDNELLIIAAGYVVLILFAVYWVMNFVFQLDISY